MPAYTSEPCSSHMNAIKKTNVHSSLVKVHPSLCARCPRCEPSVCGFRSVINGLKLSSSKERKVNQEIKPETEPAAERRFEFCKLCSRAEALMT